MQTYLKLLCEGSWSATVAFLSGVDYLDAMASEPVPAVQALVSGYRVGLWFALNALLILCGMCNDAA